MPNRDNRRKPVFQNEVTNQLRPLSNGEITSSLVYNNLKTRRVGNFYYTKCKQGPSVWIPEEAEIYSRQDKPRQHQVGTRS